ncbi:DUF3298 and DUF4163 domain-containing protein [Patescibacteria group bacterium]|nr:DUF3298 and DUF4163 domain-containing protein [Patescibacteria group bacterium]
MKKIIFFSVFITLLSVMGAGCDQNKVTSDLSNDDYQVKDEQIVVTDNQGSEKPEILYVEDVEVIPSDWLTYKNEEYGFEFRYPNESRLADSDMYDDLVHIVFPPEYKPDDGFSAVSRRELDVTIQSGDNLASKCDLQYACGIATKRVNFGKNNFCLSMFGDGAAGTMYHIYDYELAKDDELVDFIFTIPEVNCGAYDYSDGCVPMDEGKETELFKLIVSSFKSLDDNAVEVVDENFVNVADRRIEEGDDYYSIEITYPYFISQDGKYDELNRVIGSFVNDEFDWFRDDTKNIDPEFEVGKWFMGYDYEITSLGDDYVSLLLEGSVYTGGAHPGPLYKTIIFDLKENEEVGLSNLFIKDFDYLDFLSLESKKKLPKAEDFSDDDWIVDGTLPAAENFELFYVDENDVKIIFPPYQVAPYAAGPQVISFSEEELQKYLDDKWIKRLTQ